MQPNVSRSRIFFFVIHWILILAGLVLLGLGWSLHYMDLNAADRIFVLETHVSLGLTLAFLLLIQCLIMGIARPLALDKAERAWRRSLQNIAIAFIYIAMALLIGSGYLERVFAGAPVSFWTLPLPAWATPDPGLDAWARTIHTISAYVLAGLIGVNAILGGLGLFESAAPPEALPEPLPQDEMPLPEAQEVPPPVPAAQMPIPAEVSRPAPVPSQTEIDEAREVLARKHVQGLASNLRIFGWINFWVQFVLALVAVLLLTFATSGHAFSPGKFGEAIYFAWYGFALLILSIGISLYYVKAGGRVVAKPLVFLNHENSRAFWFLLVGLLVSGFGVLISFAGLTMSITVLVVKAIAFPPGIAITDPQNMIRALDIFVLILNFILVIGHFVALVSILWLGMRASKVRLDYLTLSKLPA
jgi:cytochrome b561